MIIDTKAKMYRELARGAFGNHMRSWERIQEIEACGYRGLVTIRSRDISNPLRKYYNRVEDLRDVLAQHKVTEADVAFQEVPPDERDIQGEVMHRFNDCGLALYWTNVHGAMRTALERWSANANGLEAKLRLQQYLDPADYDWLMELLDVYPGHVIEFSNHVRRTGTLHRRMVVWEIRKY